MKKLTLNVETLRVESFATQDVPALRGTVRGHDDTIETEWCTIDGETCFYATCPTIKTCRVAGDTDAVPIH